MVRFPFGTRNPDTSSILSDTQRSLVEEKFELLQRASVHFTQDRLLHLQGEDLNLWTGACTGELRRRITSVAASDVEISLIAFPPLRCVSLQCVPRTMAARTANAPDAGSARRIA